MYFGNEVFIFGFQWFFLKMKKYIWVILYIYLKSFCRFLSKDQPYDKSSNKSCQLDVKTLFYYFLKNITDLLYVIHLRINLIYKLKGPFWFTFLSYNKPLSYWLSCLWSDNICFLIYIYIYIMQIIFAFSC